MKIFVGGEVQDLGSDAMLTDLDTAETDGIREFLDRYEIPFKGGFSKIVNAGKKLRYTTEEEQVRSLPFFEYSGDSEYWKPEGPRKDISHQVADRTLSHSRLRRRPPVTPHRRSRLPCRPVPRRRGPRCRLEGGAMRTEIGGTSTAPIRSRSVCR